MSYSLHIYVADSEFPIAAFEAILQDLDFARGGDAWRWHYAEADLAAAVRVEVARVSPQSPLAPASAHWRVDVHTAHGRGAAEVWRQLAVPYRALRHLARVEVCDPEAWSEPAPRRFASPERFHAHASAIVGHLAAPDTLIGRGLMSEAGFLLL